MRRTICLITVLLLFQTCSYLSPKHASGEVRQRSPVRKYVPHELLVRFLPGTDEAEKQAVRKELGAWKVKVIESIEVEYWKLPEDVTTEEALDFLRNTPCVESAEPNSLYKPQAVPNDPLFNYLWYLHNYGQYVNGTSGIPGADISAPEAWNIETGNRNIVIAVIDTGVAFDHPDLVNNVWTNEDEVPNNGIDDDYNGYIDDVHGWDFVNNDNNPSDYSKDVYGDGHGTHVAGIIAAQGNNGIGITGVMWNAQIMPLQIYDLYYESPFQFVIQSYNIIRAIQYAVDNGAKIINCSFGGGTYSQYQYDEINYANQHGVLVICAAGNDGMDNDSIPSYPASYDLPNIISVAATNELDQLASYSNYGLQSVDVAAPGGSDMAANIYSTVPPERKVLFYDDFEHGGDQWITWGIYEPWSIGYNIYFGSNVVRDSVFYYHENESSYLRTAYPVDATNCRGLVLECKIAYDLEPNYDFCYVQGSFDGVNWYDLGYITGNSNGIIQYKEWYSELDLGRFYLGLKLESDYLYNYQGVSIDDIKITGIPWHFVGNEYGYKSGTSMAAPVVSGLAGLIWSHNPNLTYLEVKSIILNTVDKLPLLEGKTVSGGRVNAYKALFSITPEMPLNITPKNLTLEAGASYDAIISGGTAPYTATSSDKSVTTAVVSGSTVTITAVAAGSATVTVTDSASNSVEVTVSVTAAAPSGQNVNELTGTDIANAPVYLGSVATGGDEMELDLDFPSYETAVDEYAAVQTPDGMLFFVASDGSLTTDMVAYATGVTDATSVSILGAFNVCTPFGAAVPTGTWYVYSLVVRTNGGDITTIDWAAGDYDLEFYTFDVTCP